MSRAEPEQRNTGTREIILEAAERLFAERGFAATSVRDIVGEADTSAPSLYHFFGSKENLLVELIGSGHLGAKPLSLLREQGESPGRADQRPAHRVLRRPRGGLGTGENPIRRLPAFREVRVDQHDQAADDCEVLAGDHVRTPPEHSRGRRG
ncbi:MAG: helix-turn-helix transcriptional regulator [Deltaproteobacteria bacterium]|nr:helix-turn-helix transcriptional regulator [Deltaproteobacteria bacterium]